MKFLANTGYLFQALPFPDRLTAAARAGFDGVEFHDEVQRHDAGAIAAVLEQSGLSVGSLNSRMGETAGCAALPGFEAEFAADIRAADAAARRIGARAIHVLAGRGATDRATYAQNLRRALELTDLPLLIEPISRAAMPQYHLHRLDDALDLRDRLGCDRITILFDWFHISAEAGPQNAADLLARHRAAIGHVQAAGFPARTEPEPRIITTTAALAFPALGLEYRPTRPEAQTLAQLRDAGQSGQA